MNFKEAFKMLVRDAHYYQYAGVNSSELSIKKEQTSMLSHQNPMVYINNFCCNSNYNSRWI